MKYRTEDNDPLRDAKDWLDHRYDPGYYVGGNIHPVLKARRPNKYGYVLIFSGLCLVLLAVAGLGALWIARVVQIAVALLLFAAGVKLVRVPAPREPTDKNRRD